MEMSLSEYNDAVWKMIDTGDFIMVRSYLESDEVEITSTLEEIVEGKETNIEDVIKIDFAGIITNKEKNVGSTEQYRIEAVDIVKILQQLNVSVAMDEDDGWISSDIINP